MTKNTVAIIRPGAIGDIIMSLNLVPLLREKYPDQIIAYYCNNKYGASLRPIMQAAGVDRVANFEEIVKGTLTFDAHLKTWFKAHALMYPYDDGYPHNPMNKHLIRYFADGMKLTFKGPLPSLHLRAPDRIDHTPTRYATIHVKTSHSAYKEWPIDRWNQVVKACDNIKFIQVGQASEPKVEGADTSFMGVPLMTSIALIANAAFHVGVDSFSNHLTNYTWEFSDGSSRMVPGVILWGSTQPSSAGYLQNKNLVLNLPCQPCFRERPDVIHPPNVKFTWSPCPNPPLQVYTEPRHACMYGINVDEVISEVQRLNLKTK